MVLISSFFFFDISNIKIDAGGPDKLKLFFHGLSRSLDQENLQKKARFNKEIQN